MQIVSPVRGVEGTEVKKKILIVEDDIDLIQTLGLALELQGYEPIRATDGKQVIDMLSKHHPDLILLDVSMPDMDMDGLEIAFRTHEDQIPQTIPILCVIGESDVSSREACLLKGCSNYISEPISMDQLRSSIEHLLT